MTHSLLPASWKVPEVFRARLGERAGRQRAMVHEGHLLLVLHKLPEAGESDRDALLFWRAPDGKWCSTGSGAGLAVLDELLGNFERAADELEARLSKAVSAKEFYEVLRISAPLLRTVSHQHAALQQGRDTVAGDRQLLLARDRSVDLVRALELAHQDARQGLDFMVAQQAERQAQQGARLVETGHRLNLLIGVFLPLTAVSAAFGMNLTHGLEGRSPILFWLVLPAVLVLGLMVRHVLVPARKESARPPSGSS